MNQSKPSKKNMQMNSARILQDQNEALKYEIVSLKMQNSLLKDKVATIEQEKQSLLAALSMVNSDLMEAKSP